MNLSNFINLLCLLTVYKTIKLFNFRKMLKLGASKHWSYALRGLSGEKEVKADPIFEYFEPLIKWLQIENSKYSDNSPGF